MAVTMSTGLPASGPSFRGELGPAWAAAQQTMPRAAFSAGGLAGYRTGLASADPAGDSVALHAARAMRTASSRAEVALVLHAAINDLGGAVVPARLAGPDAMPVDVALGVGEPKVVVVLEPLDSAHLRIVHHLPLLVEDAKAAAGACDSRDRQSHRDSVDALTGVASRRRIGQRLAATGPGAIACMLDIDGLRAYNVSHGHAAGDRALRDFGTVLLGSVRDDDFVARYGGGEFLVLMGKAPLQAARDRLRDAVTAWSARTGDELTVSGGLAVVDERGAVAAVRAADNALYRSRRSGQNHLVAAIDDEYDSSPLPFGEPR